MYTVVSLEKALNTNEISFEYITPEAEGNIQIELFLRYEIEFSCCT